MQLGAAKQQAVAAQQREAGHSAALRRAEARVAELEHAVAASRETHSQQQAALGAVKASSASEASAREQEWAAKCAALRTEASTGRQQLLQQQQQAAELIPNPNPNPNRNRSPSPSPSPSPGPDPKQAAEVIANLQETMRRQQEEAELKLATARTAVPISPLPPPPSNGAPLSPASGAAGGAAAGAAAGADALRAQLALAEKRASVGAEYRQLSESYKAKAERLEARLHSIPYP